MYLFCSFVCSVYMDFYLKALQYICGVLYQKDTALWANQRSCNVTSAQSQPRENPMTLRGFLLSTWKAS